MASASVHKSPETGKYCVVGKDNQILHTFDSEGEANLQVLALEQAEKEAKANDKEEHKAEAKNAKHDDDEGKSHGRHR
jgi:hypothetical protein